MRLKCSKCGWITDYEFPTAETHRHAGDMCLKCGTLLLTENDIKKAAVLADLEDKGMMLPVCADNSRAMIVVDGGKTSVNDKSVEPESRRMAALRPLGAKFQIHVKAVDE